ncbi:hypothetical protein 3S16_12 [uncultured Caudovirales phage]|uniref:Phage protein n=1 Tax=uncultured Caudovirales phage TaxID=2100421 RepID=A0A2H4JBN7_9CAUD|nr:hypothetical protein 3S16_12 [uncultured Caudovirales phage]
MNKQELIERIEGLKNIFGNKTKYIEKNTVIELVSKLDEPETGSADEAPRYVKNVLARLRELPDHDREVWLKAIMGEFEQDFSRAKWREGYEQGKFEGMVKREKVTIPQFVADWIEYCKVRGITLAHALYHSEEAKNKSVYRWLFEKSGRQETFAQAWIFGYEVEEEKRYLVKVKGICGNHETLNREKHSNKWLFSDREENSLYGTHHTRKELEDANFGWVFDCEGIEIEEVE